MELSSNWYPYGPSPEQQRELAELRLGFHSVRSNFFPNGPTVQEQAAIDAYRKSLGTPFL
jgi:hypothetical protein